MNLNASQQIFLVFYAVFWGTSAIAQSRWKAFHYTFFLRIPQVTSRIILSFIFLNVFPVFYFILIFDILNNLGYDQLSINLVLRGIVPAIAIFGIYRIWNSIIAFFPHLFYRKNTKKNQYPPAKIEPTIKSLKLNKKRSTRIKNGILNLIFGIVYIIGSFLVAVYLP